MRYILLPHEAIKLYEKDVLDPAYHPATSQDCLKARFTAVMLLSDRDLAKVELARAFILRTSTTKEEDLQRLEIFSARVTQWVGLEICSAYANTNLQETFLEYKLQVETSQGGECLHRHAFYKIENNICTYVSQIEPLIRIISDPILHKEGKLFPEKPTEDELRELTRQIKEATDALIKTSGAGIAANQCARISDPYQFAIVGVFHERSDHVKGVGARYPGTEFPEAAIMVNPKIIKKSEEQQSFNHGCLSVPCSNRCAVKSPYEITVQYLDPLNNLQLTEKTYESKGAVVLWHELNHILDGKTYIDTALASLNEEDLDAFKEVITEEIHKREKQPTIPDISSGRRDDFKFTITISQDGISKLDKPSLEAVSKNMTIETLSGILARCNELKSRANYSNDVEENKKSYQLKVEISNEYSMMVTGEENDFLIGMKKGDKIIGDARLTTDNVDVSCITKIHITDEYVNVKFNGHTLGEIVLKFLMKFPTNVRKLEFRFALDIPDNLKAVISKYKFDHGESLNPENEIIMVRTEDNKILPEKQSAPDNIAFEQFIKEKYLPELLEFLKINAVWQAHLTLERLKILVNHSRCFVALSDTRKIVGFARVLTNNNSFASLWDVVIDEKYRRKGIATHLMLEIFTDSKLADIKNWILFTKPDVAERLYRKFGFIPENEAPIRKFVHKLKLQESHPHYMPELIETISSKKPTRLSAEQTFIFLFNEHGKRANLSKFWSEISEAGEGHQENPLNSQAMTLKKK